MEIEILRSGIYIAAGLWIRRPITTAPQKWSSSQLSWSVFSQFKVVCCLITFIQKKALVIVGFQYVHKVFSHATLCKPIASNNSQWVDYLRTFYSDLTCRYRFTMTCPLELLFLQSHRLTTPQSSLARYLQLWKAMVIRVFR